MLAMMAIHSTGGSSQGLSFIIWDFFQWAVPVFLFCSSYLFFNQTRKFKFKDVFPYFKKRAVRLFVPYYIFLSIFFLLSFFYAKENLTRYFLKASLLLTGGISYNWLVLVIAYLSILMPVIFLIKKRSKPMYYLYFIISLASSIYFIFHSFDYRTIMWLPWSVLIYFSIFFLENRRSHRKIFLMWIFSLILFLIIRYAEFKIGHNTSQFANKYPPNLYHLSFGFFWIITLNWLSQKKAFNVFRFDRFLSFLSINSYTLFFIHILVISMIGWLHLFSSSKILFFGIVVIFSSLIQLGLNSGQKLLSRIFPIKLFSN